MMAKRERLAGAGVEQLQVLGAQSKTDEGLLSELIDRRVGGC